MSDEALMLVLIVMSALTLIINVVGTVWFMTRSRAEHREIQAMIDRIKADMDDPRR